MSIRKHHSREILIDTNLLLLLFVGTQDRAQISRFKRTNSLFTEADYDLLLALLQEFKTIITTPQIMTEVSNLMGQMEGKLKATFYQQFARYVLSDSFFESTVPSKEIVKNPAFLRLGISDVAIGQIAKDNYLVLTTDFSLYGYLISQGINAVNFNHVRTQGWAEALGIYPD
jgi:hypothetical protein